MSVIRSDHRALRTRPEPRAHDRIVGRLDAWIRSELRFARDFARLEASSTWAEWGCASVVEYGTRHGYRAAQVRGWATLGKALTAVPALKSLVLEQRIPVEHAETIAPLLLEPTLTGERSEWLDLAERTSARRLRSYVTRRLEQVRQDRDDLQPITIWTTRRTKHDWQRARDVVAMKKRRRVSEGEAFAFVVDYLLEREDPLRKAARLEGTSHQARAPAHGAVSSAGAASSRVGVPATDWPSPPRGGGQCVAPGPVPTLPADLFAGRDGTVELSPADGMPPDVPPDVPPAARCSAGEPAGGASGAAGSIDEPAAFGGPIPIGDPSEFLAPKARSRRTSNRTVASDDARRRHVSAGVRRQIWLRAGGTCEVPGCGCRLNLQLCHIRAWARGGANGRWNLLLLCPRHHLLLDAGCLRFLRWTEEGPPTFRLAAGEVLHPEARAPPGIGRSE